MDAIARAGFPSHISESLPHNSDDSEDRSHRIYVLVRVGDSLPGGPGRLALGMYNI